MKKRYIITQFTPMHKCYDSDNVMWYIAGDWRLDSECERPKKG